MSTKESDNDRTGFLSDSSNRRKKSWWNTAPVRSIIEEIIKEGEGPKPKPKPKPKNYLADNVKNIRRIQAKKKNVAEERKPKKTFLPHAEPFICGSSSRSDNERGSQLTTQKQISDSCTSTKAEDELAELSLVNPVSASDDRSSISSGYRPCVSTSKKSEGKVPASDDCSSKSSRCRSCLSVSENTQDKITLPHKLGYIPEYIKEYNAKVYATKVREEQAKKLNTPEGYLLLPEDDRIETLKSLNEWKDELYVALNSLPVRSDTSVLRQEKAQLEQKLAKAEEGINIFSRPYVFVKVSD